MEKEKMAPDAIKHIEALTVHDTETDKPLAGCNQEWFGTKWQRLAGCGPTTATNLIMYLNNTRPELAARRIPGEKPEVVALMEEVWKFVTPGLRGMPTTKMFCTGAQNYANEAGVAITCHARDVPRSKVARPPFSEIVAFVRAGLQQDVPVAFLNLCNGDETGLDEWHWVTIISLECGKDDNAPCIVKTLDNNELKRADLSLWYRTTIRGGGFAYFS